ncbi:hypothetical protein [Kangiella sediminilitoris]|uniref:Tetratricopeptide repeat protein n=1 Tax=Kangiella sediminilitoris TaxID=1144748 RepID=A0A1B3B916_9GAMM|nr:hypothetical protein [Kangiella sediminilitoris]AOE49246.1 hypothetical protein KS2013_522 [Kangiella sediminilitoris]
MVNNKKNTQIPAVIFLLLVSPLCFSKQWIPENEDQVILQYKPDQSGKNILEKQSYSDSQNIQELLDKMSSLIELSQLPGNSHYLNVAKNIEREVTSKKYKLSTEQQSQLTLVQANIEQQSHNFRKAIEHLNNIKINSRYYAQSLLIKARLYLIQGNYGSAETSCRSLIPIHIQAGELCSIEVKIYQEAPGLTQPLRLLKRRYNSETSSSSLSRYYFQILATYFLIQEDYIGAEEAFAYDLLNAPSSQWYQWADMVMKNSRPQQVYSALKTIADSTSDNSSLEDGFIVRLARAEKAMKSSDYTYRNLAQQRVKLRQHRNDRLHAADIAYYYIHVVRAPDLAMKWATINWEQVKEPGDRALLRQAKALNYD